MSTSFHSKTKSFDPAMHAVVEGVFGIEKQDLAEKAALAEQDRLNAEADTANAAAADRLETRQVATRGQELRAGAAAAGATRSGNEQDVLSGGKPRAKRRYASQELLGG